MLFKRVKWSKVENRKCEICGKGREKGAKESTVITKKFIGILYSKTTICQSCISKMLRNFTKGV